MVNNFELVNFSELSLKAFETGKPFNAKENDKFCQWALQGLQGKLIERAKKENEKK